MTIQTFETTVYILTGLLVIVDIVCIVIREVKAHKDEKQAKTVFYKFMSRR